MNADLQSSGESTTRAPGRLPALAWLKNLTPSHIRADVLAGLTLAAYLLPAGIGDASLAQLPPEAGLYACLFSGLVFWALCSSRRTAITVTSAISLLLGTSVGAIADGDVTRFGALAACTALLVAAIAFTAWLIRAGSLVSFVSETVLIGFKAGVALTLASTQLPKLFGIKAGHGDFWHCSHVFFTHLADTNGAALAIGLGALLTLMLGKVFFKNKPVAIFVVVGGIIAGSAFGLHDYGVKMLGEVPQGLPSLGLPAVTWSDINELVPLAMACFLLGAVETVAIGRMFAAKHGGRLDANQEFLALAAANLAAGLGRGFPVSGGMSQSLVNESAGAKSPLSGLVAAIVVLIVVLFLSGTLKDLPQPVLAAIVLMAVLGLVKVDALKHLWRHDRTEFLVAMATLAGVLTTGLLRGVLIGAVISLIMLIRRASQPKVAFLGRIPGTQRFSDIDRHPDNEPIAGVLIVRPESSIVYFNADHIRDSVMARVRMMSPVPRTVVCELSNAPHVDLAGAEMFKSLASDLRAMGITLQLVEARSSVRDRLRAEGLEEQIGHVDRFTSVADAVNASTADGLAPR